MSWKSVIAVMIVMACRTSCKRIVCQMVSLETDDGLSGYCCVIFRNMSKITLENDEVQQQILDSLKINGTMDEVSTRISENNSSDSDVANFPTESEDETGFKFPDEFANITLADPKIVMPSEQSEDNSTSPEDKSNMDSEENEDIVQFPDVCPEGSEKDVNDDCVPVFSESEDESGFKFPDESANITLDDPKIVMPSEQSEANSTRPEDTSNNQLHITDTNFGPHKNMVTVPNTCPEGNEEDINGDCVPVFSESEDESGFKFSDEFANTTLDPKIVMPSKQSEDNSTSSHKSNYKLDINVLNALMGGHNRVAFPEICPEGNEEDINGDCVPVF